MARKCRINSTTKLFANDTKLYSVTEWQENVRLLQEDINKLSKWSDTWLLKFNKNKSKHLHLGRNFQTKYKLNNEKISNECKEKDLGEVLIMNSTSKNILVHKSKKQTKCLAL